MDCELLVGNKKRGKKIEAECYIKVKVSHSLIAVGALGLESSHCILGTVDERRSPFLSFAALSFPNSKKVPIYCWVGRESFPVITWQSAAWNLHFIDETVQIRGHNIWFR